MGAPGLLEESRVKASPPVGSGGTVAVPRPPSKPWDLPGGTGQGTLKLEVSHFDLWYGEKQALFDINLRAHERTVTALIGPSGCGKSTLLRSLNRMNDLVDGVSTAGSVALDGQEIYTPDLEVELLRRLVGMVFQKPNPFPKSIYDNVAYGLRIQGERRPVVLDEAVERSLRASALWTEVKDRLDQSGLGLSGRQQQRVCIDPGLATGPHVLPIDQTC